MSLRASVLPRSTRPTGPSHAAEHPAPPGPARGPVALRGRLPGRRAVTTDRAVRAHLALATVAACALGLVLPETAALIRHCRPVPGANPPMLMLLAAMFIGGFEVRAADAARALLRPGLLLAGLGVALVLRMLVLLGAERAADCWPDPHEALWLVVGLSLTATMPVAGSAQTWGAKAQANAPLGLGLVLATTLLSPLTVPLGLVLAEEPEAGGPRQVLDALARSDSTCGFMALWVAAPCLAGLAARRLTRGLVGGRFRAAVLPWLRLLGLLNALGLTYLNAAGVFGEIGRRPEPRLVALALLAGGAVCAVPFLAGWLTARQAHIERDTTAALTLATGLNNTSAAAALAGSQFSGHPAVLLPIFFYGMTQQLLAACAPRLLRARDRRGSRTPYGPGGSRGPRGRHRARRLHAPNGRRTPRGPGRRRKVPRPPAPHPPATCTDVPMPSPRPDFTRT
ncbi:bile acid:sodium symporter [Saccharothrix sp. ST-888]|uniref:bile acid:sodium symporter n=1 Tax=Saccharothrix sp. ST-888 TaxID=1427391 RepID=UPI000A798CB7|nr:bile acid:sodium symporter [Saccharothrix sp. ST-888]